MEAIKVISSISALLTVVYVLVILTFIKGWFNIKRFTPARSLRLTTKVSIIVAARNEEKNVRKTIEDLLMQTYDQALTEIIIIDDHSTDDTAQIIASYEPQGVRLIKLNEERALNSYKKKAIQTAISGANGQLIITTDADCRMGSKWLETIVSFYETNQYKMISSPVVFFEEKSFFERAQTLEFLYLIGLGASTIGNNKASTCNGANLAYERDAFYSVGGFQGIDDLASGDDELLLHKMAAKYKNAIGFLKSKDAIVYTHAKPTLSEFIQQRKRWASKSTRYKNKSIIILGVCIWVFNLTIIINFVAGFIDALYLKIFIWQLVVKIIAEYCFLAGVTKFAGRRELLKLLPVLNIMHVLYIVYIGVAGNSGKYNWKGRMVK